METCPFGCVINENSSLLSRNNRQLPYPKRITNNISYSNLPNNLLYNFNNTSLDNHHQLMDDFQPICVLEVCAHYSVTDCLNHTEDICFPSEDGCRFLKYFFCLFCFYYKVYYQNWELFII
jgi:hypothetical protein